MTAPTLPEPLTRSKVATQLRAAYQRIGDAQKHVRTKSAQVRFLRTVLAAIRAAEADALEDVRHAAEERNFRLALRALAGKQP